MKTNENTLVLDQYDDEYTFQMVEGIYEKEIAGLNFTITFEKNKKTYVTLVETGEKMTPDEKFSIRQCIDYLIAQHQEKFPQFHWKREGKFYENIRLALGYSKREMSRRIGCSETKIRNFEQGSPVGSPEMMRKSYEAQQELKKLKTK